MQLPLLIPEKTWKPSLYFPPINRAKRISIDVETRDPDLKTLGPGVRRRGSNIVGIALAIEKGPSVYYPIGHEGGDNLDKEAVTNWCHAEFKKYKGEVVGANLLYDLDWLSSEGIFFGPECRFLDVQYAEALLNEHRKRYNLDSLAKEYLGTTKREDELKQIAKLYGVDPKAELWKLPGAYVGRYALGDVELPLDILKIQERKLDEQNLNQIWQLETDLLPVMLAMRQKGIRIDEEKLKECSAFFFREECTALLTIKTETGIDLTDRLWMAESCAEVLRKLKIDFPFTEKTHKPSIKADWLDNIDHPVAQVLSRARRFNKARTTFCASIERHMTYGRIHPNFNQLKGDDGGTVTGRLSCKNPNIQQQPIRNKEIGRMFRSIYLPDEGYQYGRFDYKEQEPKIALHYAILSGQQGAADLLKKHATNPNMDSYSLISSELERDTCKTVYLELLYSASGLKICEGLNLPTVWREDRKGGLHEYPGPEAQGILDNFEQGAPWVIGLIRDVTRSARSKGYVRTILGRKNRFPLITPKNMSREFHSFRESQEANFLSLSIEEQVEIFKHKTEIHTITITGYDNEGQPQIETSSGYDFVYKATSKLIQGSAADQMKKALVDLYAAGYTPHLQMHDEAGISVHGEEQAKEIKAIMENAVELKIPALVDYTLGANWGKCK